MTLREERNHALGWVIIFFGLAWIFIFLAHNSFSNGALKLGAAMIILAFVMSGTSAFCSRHLLICRYVEKMKKGKEEKSQ